MTPGRHPNRASGPQNQPNEKVAVSTRPGALASTGSKRLGAASAFRVGSMVSPPPAVRMNPARGYSPSPPGDRTAPRPARVLLALVEPDEVAAHRRVDEVLIQLRRHAAVVRHVDHLI